MLGAIQAYVGLAEPVASASHLLGAAVFGLLAARLVRAGGPDDIARTRILKLFCAAVVAQLTISGLYHAFPLDSAARVTLQRLDYGVIWLLIAGSFTPVWLFLLRGRWGDRLLVGVWAFALFAFAVETLFFGLVPRWIAVLIHVIFASIGTPVAIWLVIRWGLRRTLPFFCCGVSFSLAALIQLPAEAVLLAGVVEYHELVHLLVLVGIGFHWTFVSNLARSAAEAPAPAGSVPLPVTP